MLFEGNSSVVDEMLKLFFVFLGALIAVIEPSVADTLRVMYGVSRPPFIMERDRSGISYELATATFDRMGMTTRPFFGSNERLEAMLQRSIHLSFGLFLDLCR